VSAPTILPPTLSAYIREGEGEGAAREARPVQTRPRGVVKVPALPALMADYGYPVSGDEIARAIHDPHPQNVSVTGRQLSRVPFGDLLWPVLATAPHPGRN